MSTTKTISSIYLKNTKSLISTRWQLSSQPQENAIPYTPTKSTWAPSSIVLKLVVLVWYRKFSGPVQSQPLAQTLLKEALSSPSKNLRQCMESTKRQASYGATTTSKDTELTSEVFDIPVWSVGVRTPEEEPPTTLPK